MKHPCKAACTTERPSRVHRKVNTHEQPSVPESSGLRVRRSQNMGVPSAQPQCLTGMGQSICNQQPKILYG